MENNKINILVAPNSMKGSLSAFDFTNIVEKAFNDCSDIFLVRKVPVADGGDFTGEVLQRNFQASEIKKEVQGPLGEKIQSRYFISGDKAIIEMADASGMKLIGSAQLNPLKASSFGTGELIADAITKGCNQIFIAIGGSATVDGGAGMLEALGFRFLGTDGRSLTGNGANLSAIRKIQYPDVLPDITINIICDVDNPLLGDNGAAYVFGPQKGATTEMLPLLDGGLKNWCKILETMSGKKLARVSGAGAAGGMSLPLIAFFDAKIVPGADFVLEQLAFEKQVKWADIVITGEGKIDGQTLNNKAPLAVAKMARKFSKPVFAIGGAVEKEAAVAFDGVFSLVNSPMKLEQAMENAQELLYFSSYELAKTVKTLFTKKLKDE